MSEKQQNVAIGAFVLGAALIALLVFIYLAGSGFGNREKVVMVFDGSVKGLNVGAPLALRGVQVGQVTRIEVILDSDNVELLMLVEADFNTDNVHLQGEVSDNLAEELLSRGLRAQLNTQSLLTGLLYIQLDFFPGTKLELADIDSPYFQFPTVPSDLERITRKLQDIDLSRLVDDLNGITRVVKQVVDSNELQQLPATLQETLTSLTSLSEQLQAQLASSGPKLDTVLDETAVTVGNAREQLPRITALIASNLEVLDDAIASIERTASGVDNLVAPDSATVYQLNMALQELARAGRSLQSLAATMEAQPEALLRGRRGQ